MSDTLLVVSPLELKFELRKNIPVTLTLTNTSSERVAFKVKTTSPKKYCVRPSNGFVEPNSTRDVQVIMQAQKEMPASFADCKDKFLIQSVRVGSGGDLKEVTPDMFDPAKAQDIRQIKLRVQLLGPPKPPSPVPEGVEEPLSPATQRGGSTYKETASTKPLESDAGRVVTSAAAEKAEIKKRLDNLQQEGHSKGGQQAGGSELVVARAPPTGGFGLIHLVLVALLAFFIGRIANIAVPFITSRLQNA